MCARTQCVYAIGAAAHKRGEEGETSARRTEVDTYFGRRRDGGGMNEREKECVCVRWSDDSGEGLGGALVSLLAGPLFVFVRFSSCCILISYGFESEALNLVKLYIVWSIRS